MSYTMTGVVTGGAQTGFTSNTYTLSADNAPDVRSKQSAVTTLGGTQVGVVTHTVNAPFTVTIRRPSIFKTIVLAVLNGVTGQYSKIPFNEHTMLVRKAAQVALNQWVINEYRATFKIYAGTETYDSVNLRAGVSLFAGLVSANSSGIADELITGVL